MKRKTVSLCMIARDEEATIGMAIKSVLALVDEVIVVDSGSRDNTRIIAEGYGARVIDVAWEDDFAKTRNEALREATGHWILVLDADEVLQPVRPVEFQRLLHDPAAAGYRLRLVHPGQEPDADNDLKVRLFRNEPEIRFQYPIFERIVPSLNEWARPQGLMILESDLAVLCENTQPDRKARQRERNLRILRKATDLYPDEPYFPYKMSCEGLSLLEEEVLPVAGLNSALANLNLAWRKARALDPAHQQSLPWLPDLGAKITSALLATDRLEEARLVVGQVRDLFPRHPLVLLQSVAVASRMLDERPDTMGPAAAEDLLADLRADLDLLKKGPWETNGAPVDRRVLDLYPLRYLGELALRDGEVSTAVMLYEQALSQDPTYSFGWLGMAECSRFAGDRKRALKLYLRTVTENAGNHRAWLRGCGLMREMGFADNAESWWRKVVDQFPEHPEVAGAREKDLADSTPLTPRS